MPYGDFVVVAFLAEVTVTIPINKILNRIPLDSHNLVTAQEVEDIVALGGIGVVESERNGGSLATTDLPE